MRKITQVVLRHIMGKFSGILLASDFDGTLADSSGKVNVEQINKIKYFVNNGGLFTVCTGRTVPGFTSYNETYINAPVIVSNGAMLYDYKNKKIIFKDCIDSSAAQLLDKLQKSFPFMSTELYSDNFRVFAINPDERTLRHFAGQGLKHTVIHFAYEADFPIVKAMLGVGRGAGAELQKMLDIEDMKNVKYIPTDGDFVELNSRTTDKGAGLIKLAELLKIDKNNVYAIGDGSNDVDMLRAAKIGFVPSNADSFARAAGDVTVCSNDENAVSAAIEYIENNL